MSWIDESSPTHLVCRDIGIRHQWEPTYAERIGGVFKETIECQRCGTQKHRYLSPEGMPLKTVFEYAEGYVRKGGGRATRAQNAEIRMAAFKARYKI